MTDRELIMSCALGDVELEKREGFYSIVVPVFNLFDTFVAVARFEEDDKLPGGKFTAKEFLEVYLQAPKSWGVQRYWEASGCAIRAVTDIGTWHFSINARDMAVDALKEWGGE